ncbi:hypothetical protein M0R19_01350 [Candidatus Pacearchaeota archaeon]|nr:hypothetical protein [Candidatus Pacearchaeota archaeon]
MEKSIVHTMYAKIYVGLREGYTNIIHDISELEELLQKETDKGGLCVTVTPTKFIYKEGNEIGAIVGLINYPRFPTTEKQLEEDAEKIAQLCKDKFKQNRISIEYQDKTVMI